MTNYEKIKNMSLEEMKNFLFDLADDNPEMTKYDAFVCHNCPHADECNDGITCPFEDEQEIEMWLNSDCNKKHYFE